MGKPLEDGGFGDDDCSVYVHCCDLILMDQAVQLAFQLAPLIERLDTFRGFYCGRYTRRKHRTAAALTLFIYHFAFN